MPILIDTNINKDPLPGRIGSGSSYALFSNDGTLVSYGQATAFDDLRIEGMNTRVGGVAPTDETGFRGDINHMMRSFVHTQADEVQFTIQLPHACRIGSELHPHVHFSPEVSGSNGNQASFVLEYYASGLDGLFPATTSSLAMSSSWSGNKQWYHLIAGDTASSHTMTASGISDIFHCRLYRNNTGACNLQGKVAFLYFDVHYEVDSFGSSQEGIK